MIRMFIIGTALLGMFTILCSAKLSLSSAPTPKKCLDIEIYNMKGDIILHDMSMHVTYPAPNLMQFNNLQGVSVTASNFSAIVKEIDLPKGRVEL